jgi:hypothetical protein
MTDVTNNSVVFHFAHVIEGDNCFVSSCSNVDIDDI